MLTDAEREELERLRLHHAALVVEAEDVRKALGIDSGPGGNWRPNEVAARELAEELHDAQRVLWAFSIGKAIRDASEDPTAWIVDIPDENRCVNWHVVQRGFPDLPIRVVLNDFHEIPLLTPEAREIIDRAMRGREKENG